MPILALDARDSRLLLVGGEFFPRIVQALVPNETRTFQLVVIYSNQTNQQLAQPIARNLSTQLNLPYQLMSGLQPTQIRFDQSSQYFVFITDPTLITPELVSVINQPHVLSFAPFVGSVPKGIDVGLVVKASVRPQLNSNQILTKDWAFRPFFNSIADHYPVQGQP